jgi:hypothetical protein
MGSQASNINLMERTTGEVNNNLDNSFSDN